MNKKQHAETISKQIASGTSSGDIIVMPIRDDLKKAPEVVEQIIEQKEAEEFQFVTVTELLSPLKFDLEPIN